jgi:hypothetical protein
MIAMGVLKQPFIEKPCGYSMFPHEVVPVPETWARKTCNLVSFSKHDSGGHFPVCNDLKTSLFSDYADIKGDGKDTRALGRCGGVCEESVGSTWRMNSKSLCSSE